MISVGQKLSQARLSKNLSISDVSQKTKIREEFLDSIEKGNYNKLPSPAYAAGFVRNYAKFLGLPEKETLALFRREFDQEAAYEVLPKGMPVKNLSTKSLRFDRKFLLGALAIVLIIIFLIFEYRSAIFDPTLKVDIPKEGQLVSSTQLEVKGRTDENVTLYIGDEIISIGENGNFSKKISVFPGKQAIRIRAVNTYGRESILLRHIDVNSGY